MCYNLWSMKGLIMSLDEIRTLEISERIIMVEEIWDSIAKDQELLVISDYEKAVLDSRIASLVASPHDLLSWDELKRKIKK